jgi:hypothetical protein
LATQCTLALEKQFAGAGRSVTGFVKNFDDWKAKGAAGEYDDYLFGKNGGYKTPFVAGQPNILQHVHLVPLADMAALAQWNRSWKHRSRKVSDRVLVYVSDPLHGHLLVYILPEPGSHAIARMETEKHRILMLKLVKIAERFIQDGKIIA